jgi:tetratricopeptide (TPR) repeat protein
VGKSTVVAELARRNLTSSRWRHGPRVQVWWVSGADPGGLIAGMVSVARVLGANHADLEAIAAQSPNGPDRLWALLDRASQRWLFIIDNADDPQMLAAPPIPGAEGKPARVPQLADGTGWVRASRRGLVVVSSRHGAQATWGTHALVERVGALSNEDAARVLRDLAPRAGSHEEAQALSRRLGGLPLGLSLAGSYLSSEFAGWITFDAYRQALDADPGGAWHAAAIEDESDDDKVTVMRTWEISLDELAKHGVGQARILLRLLSCFAAAQPIPPDLFKAEHLRSLLKMHQGAPEEVDRRVERGLRGLHRLALIDTTSVEAGRTAVVIHPVIADTNRAHLVRPSDGDPDPRLVRETAVTLLAIATDSLSVTAPADWPQWRLLTPHLQAVLAVASYLDEGQLATLLNATANAARSHHWMGTLTPAIELTEAALAQSSRLGEDHVGILLARQQRAFETGEQGRWAEAEHTYREVLAAERRVLGEQDLRTIFTRHDLAWVIANQGRWAEAEVAYNDVFGAKRQALGEEHPSTLITRHDLAWVIANQGRWAEAEAAFREVLGVEQRVLGEEHPSTLITRHDLAWVIANQGRWAEAEAAFREVLGVEQRVLGEEHPSTLMTRHDLAWVIGNQGRWAEAEAAFREVLGVEQRVLGKDHPSTLITRHELACVIGSKGQWAEAEAAFREVLSAEQEALGEHHPRTLVTRYELAKAIGNQGRWAEAENALRKLLEAQRGALGAEHADTLRSERTLQVLNDRTRKD